MNRLLTLFLTLSLIFIVVVDVDAHIDTPYARNLAPHRMVKKRDLLGSILGGPPQNAAPVPGGASSASAAGNDAASTGSGTASGSSTQADASKTTAAAASASATNTGNGGGILGSIIDPLFGGGSTASKANATTATPTNTTSSSATSTSASTQPTTTSSTPTSAPPTTTTISSTTSSTHVTTVTSPLPTQTSQPSSDASNGNHITRNTIVILAAIGGSIALVGIIWTIIRKWKFRPSSSFEDRMQPISWAPTRDDHDFAEKLDRSASVRSHGSFTSGNGHGQQANNNDVGGNGGLIADLPPLDYPAPLAPIGGYADLHRGATPQPPVYPQYDMPNPHPIPQPTGPGYGGGPAAPQYYGGYEQHPQQAGYEQRGY